MMTSTAWPVDAARDPDDDLDTRVYVRQPVPWHGLTVRNVMRELEAAAALKAAAAPKRPSALVSAPETPRRNVFLTPLPSDPRAPWAPTRSKEPVLTKASKLRKPRPPLALSAQARHQKPTLLLSRAQAKRARPRALPCVLFAMYFAIAFGIGQDPGLRAQSLSRLRAVGVQSAAFAHASGLRVWRVAAHTSTKLPWQRR